MASNVLTLLSEACVQLDHILDPQDLKRGLKQPGQPGKSGGNAGVQGDSPAVLVDGSPRDVVVQPAVVIQERRARDRARHPLKSMEWLLRECERDVSNRAAVCRLQSFARHGRAGDVARCSLVSKSLDSAQNAGIGLARLTQLAEALKRRHLAPIRLQDSLGQ